MTFHEILLLTIESEYKFFLINVICLLLLLFLSLFFIFSYFFFQIDIDSQDLSSIDFSQPQNSSRDCLSLCVISTLILEKLGGPYNKLLLLLQEMFCCSDLSSFSLLKTIHRSPHKRLTYTLD